MKLENRSDNRALWGFLAVLVAGGTALAGIDFSFLGLGSLAQLRIKIIGVVFVGLGLLAAFSTLFLPGIIKGAAAFGRRITGWVRGLVAKVILWAMGAGAMPVKGEPLVFTSGTEFDEFFDEDSGRWQQAVLCWVHPWWTNIEGARWIWLRRNVEITEAVNGCVVRHRRVFQIPGRALPSSVDMSVAVDDYGEISLNGKKVADVRGHDRPQKFELPAYVKPGENVLTMNIENAPGGPSARFNTNPTGVIYRIDLQF